MELFAWSEEYSVGVVELDAQHKKLFSLVNELHEAMAAGQGKEALERTLASLINYTRSHFAAEERFMKASGYPKFLQHKAEHEALTKKVLDYQKSYRTGKIALSIEVMDFLKGWLRQHVMASDKRYSPFPRGNT